MKFKKKLIHILIFFLFFCAIIILMGLFNWGSLPKAQDDPQTIEEAINSAILAHEADPTAHLGDGESLEQHKANEVLDHPAQSIVSDKFSSLNRFISYEISPDFDSNIENNSAFFQGALNVLTHNSSLTDSALAQWVNYQISDMGWSSGDIVIDFQLSLGGSSGTRQGEFNVLFAKIQLNATQYRLGYFDGTWHYGSWVTFTSHVADRWRIFYSAIDGAVLFFLNGVQIGSFSLTINFDSSDYMFNVSLARGSSSSSSIYFGGVTLGIGN